MFILQLAMLLTILGLIYIFLTWNFEYWRVRGVKGPKPLPLLGTFPALIIRGQHFADDLNDIYRQYKDRENYVGVFLLRTPLLMLVDPEMVHDVFVTSFKHFQDNDIAKLIDKKKDPLLANNPFVLSGQEWHDQRSLISPGFTSSRIRVSYSIMQSVCKSLCDYLKHEIDVHPYSGISGKDLALRFTCENIADCVFGIKAKSFTNQRIPIAEHVKMFSDNNIAFIAYTLIAGLYPNIVNMFKPKFFPRKCEDFFVNLMQQAYKIPLPNTMNRQDFRKHLLSMKEKRMLSELELASHAMTFLIDGLDTSATVISHCLLLLGRNQAAQQKLFNEIMQNSVNGELSFDKINQLSYLDACLNESIRILPPGLWSIKTCTESYQFINKAGQSVFLAVGDSVIIPIYALHQDSNYYPNPEQFKPERFLSENGDELKKFRDMGVFLGFGDGPRMCLGIRFATVQIKAAVASIVRHFKISVNEKTKHYIQLDPKSFLAQQDGGVWLDFQCRI